MDRIILHSDCNNFFASVECVQDPGLKNIPMAVAGDKEKRKGIILAKNDLAKRFGIKTAEPIWQALKKCPDLKLVPPRHELYREYSEAINKIYIDYTDLVEKFSIDESWLDVTGSTRLFGDGKTIADTIRERVKKETGVTVSVGVSFNKVFAKLGSDYKKPDATTLLARENFKEILYPLPVENMLFVGKSGAEILKKYGIETIGALAAADEGFIARKLGKTGIQLLKYARGEDNEPVRPFYYEREIKSIGKGMTFSRNITGEEEIKAGIRPLAEKIAAKLRDKKLKCTVVTVHIKDENLKTISRQQTLLHPTYLAREIFDTAVRLIRENWSMTKPIRMLTVTAGGVVSANDSVQLSLFDEDVQNERQENLELALDKIRKAYGSGIIKQANTMIDDF